MTLISSIIQAAFRECNIIPIGRTPTSDMQNEALERLQSLLLSVLGNDVGYRLDDWGIVNSTTITRPSGFSQDATGFVVEPQSRLVCNLTAATAIALDPMPQDGQRVSMTVP